MLIMKRIITALCALGLLLSPMKSQAAGPLPPVSTDLGCIGTNPAMTWNGTAWICIPPVTGTGITRLAPRTSILPWITSSNNVAQVGVHFISNDNYLMFEAPDDFDAVMPIFANAGTSNTWTLGQGVVSSSASYGASSGGILPPGVTPYDQYGVAQTTMLPLSFRSAGAYTEPYDSLVFPVNGTGYAAFELGLATTGAATSAASLPFASTNAGEAQNNATPIVGMYVYDGLGCIQAGTQVTSVSSTSVGISPAVSGTTACASGQSIWFTWASTLPLSATIPVATNTPFPSIYFGDWVPLSSLPRTDGGMVSGMNVSGTNIAGSTTVLSVNNTQVTLSANPTGTIAAGTAITFSVSPTVSAQTMPGAFKIYVSSVAGLKNGEKITGSGCLPSSNYVVEVGSDSAGNFMRLNAPLTCQIAASATLTASLVANLIAAAASTSPLLSFFSTSNKPIVLFRGVQASGSASNGWGSNNPPWNQMISGTPLWNSGGGGTSIDSRNFTGNITNASRGTGSFANGGTLLYGMLFHTRHRGVSVMVVGDSHYCGTSTAGGEQNFARRAAAMLDTPNVPVAAFDACYGGTSWGQYNWFADKYITTFKPSIAVIAANTFNVGNGSTAGEFGYTGLGMALQLARTMEGYGGVSLIAGNWVAQTQHRYSMVVSQNVSASTTIPIQPISFAASFSGASIAGTGIPGGTTASFTALSGGNQDCSTALVTHLNAPCFFLTASAPVTMTAGTIIYTDALTVAANTTASTTVTFTTPSPFTEISGNSVVSGSGIVGTPGIALTTNSTTGTFSTPQTLTAGTVISMATAFSANQNAALQISEGIIRSMGGGTIQTWDANPVMEDPANPGYFLQQYVTDGIHTGDYGHAAMATSFAPVLQSAIGN